MQFIIYNKVNKTVINKLITLITKELFDFVCVIKNYYVDLNIIKNH